MCENYFDGNPKKLNDMESMEQEFGLWESKLNWIFTF